jgi:hypothetical protein
MTKPNGQAVKEAEATPAPAPVGPALSTDQKFNIRDLQLKHQTSQLQYAQAQANAKTAETNFRDYVSKMAGELKIDVAKVQLNLDTLEFETRAAQQAPAQPAV